MIAAEFGTGQVFWSMLWFFLFFIWIWLLIAVFADIFRSDDLSGWGKALWTILVIVVPYLGVLIYLIVRGGKMRQRETRDAQQADTAMRQYIRETAGTPSAPADEIDKLADLRDRGIITDTDFPSAKAKLLTVSADRTRVEQTHAAAVSGTAASVRFGRQGRCRRRGDGRLTPRAGGGTIGRAGVSASRCGPGRVCRDSAGAS